MIKDRCLERRLPCIRGLQEQSGSVTTSSSLEQGFYGSYCVYLLICPLMCSFSPFGRVMIRFASSTEMSRPWL